MVHPSPDECVIIHHFSITTETGKDTDLDTEQSQVLKLQIPSAEFASNLFQEIHYITETNPAQAMSSLFSFFPPL